MECNTLPVSRADDDGLYRRLHPVLFERQVPPSRIDKTLPRQLVAERPGILNWLIEGIGLWMSEGLKPPASVTKALDDYRKLSSPFGDWLNERCVWGDRARDPIDPTKLQRTLVADLYGDFKEWAEGQGHDRPMSQRAFGDSLAQRQIHLAGKDGKGRKYRGPVRLKTPGELALDQARDEGLAPAAREAEEPVPDAEAPDHWEGS
jgi:putative DNA primase/helicase